MPDLIIRIVFIVLAAVVLTAASYKMFQMLQLSSYRMKGVSAWFKASKFDYAARFFALAFLSGAGMAVYLACFSAFAWAFYFGMLIFLLLGVLFTVISRKSGRQKTPLKHTWRIRRLATVTCILNGGLVFGLLALGIPLSVNFGDGFAATYYAFAALAFFLIPFTVALAHYILLPVEKLIQNCFKKKTSKALAANPGLVKIGITGSFGKTTAKNMLAAMLSKKYKVLATPESYNTPMGIAKTVGESLTSDTEVFIAEMGARYVGDIAELCRLVKPQYGVITGIGNQHLETFKSAENLFKTKYELIESLSKSGRAFFNGDSAGAAEMFGQCGIAKVITGAQSQIANYKLQITNMDEKVGAVVMYSDATFSKAGTEFRLITVTGSGLLTANDSPGHSETLAPAVSKPDPVTASALMTTSLLGKHIPAQIALCAAVALEMGVALEEIAAAVKELKPVPHRLELIEQGDTVVIDDAYNANLDGAKNALEVLAGFAGTRIVVTPGLVELGAEEEAANTEFGRAMAGACDYAILNSSRGARIKKGALEAGMSEERIILCASLGEAMQKLGMIHGANKVILFENDLPDNLK
ncbi:MAG: UDP-N-acetylmuramoyl-tripeptide--D-alanyl-D-alanine ligase [Firmicutes bacterium]|nr:UDP-N-acetylmuramoyl-tripeptide--D-alanyl-D-alanine ligase [Bacillota bacterium]